MIVTLDDLERLMRSQKVHRLTILSPVCKRRDRPVEAAAEGWLVRIKSETGHHRSERRTTLLEALSDVTGAEFGESLV